MTGLDLNSNGSDPVQKSERLVTLVMKLGVPNLILLGFAYVLAVTVPDAIKAQGRDIQAQLEMHAKESRDEAARQTSILIRICINTAKTEAQADGCWRLRAQ